MMCGKKKKKRKKGKVCIFSMLEKLKTLPNTYHKTSVYYNIHIHGEDEVDAI